ncbi:MAG: plasmid mobilization relaxosome protein MobC [Pseudomonadales bacterium]|nr:plasmid mobilization relaxosome protein MobC [Pseudomonadales bacterium]
MSDISDDKAKKYPPPFSIRFTFEERAKLDELSEGVPLGKFIKECLFKLAMRPDASARLPIQDKKLIAKLLGLLGKSRIANNLNQLAKAANSGSLPVNDEVQKALMEAADAILWMRDTLIQALGLKPVRAKQDKGNDP